MDNKAVGEILDHYQLVLGLSVTEMEIVHAAYRIDNPNGRTFSHHTFEDEPL